MIHNKIITWCVAFAIGCVSFSPAFAGYQTVYVPDNYSGQTIIYQQPPQTVIVQEPAPQTVYVQNTTVSPAGAVLAAGVGTLVGGVLLHSIFGHHHKSYRPAPPPRMPRVIRPRRR